jgi:branched-chain amino acid aminotransferase
MQQSLPPIFGTFALNHIAFCNQLLENPRQGLLGDLQDIEKPCHREARIAAHKMDDAVMRPPHAEALENVVWICHKIAICKEQQLDQRHRLGLCAQIYVSHIDIFSIGVTVPVYRILQQSKIPPEENMSIIPFDQREGSIWFNGKIVPWKEAKVHVLTHGLHYGSSVFEGERAYAGKIFKSREHTQRFRKSAQIMDFDLPYTDDEIIAAKDAVVAANGGGDQYVRPVAFRGSEMMAVSAQNNRIHVAIATWQWPSMFDPEVKMKGIRLDIADYRRPDPMCAPVHAKAAGLYMICTISKHKAEKKGYADAMMLDWQGRVAECTGANIFFTKDGQIHTPLADCFLNGITRQTVIEIAKKQGMTVNERRIMPDELPSMNECFIVGSAAEVTPVKEIGPYSFTPGNMSRSLMDSYSSLVRA